MKALLLLAAFLVPAAAHAQTPSGVITGRVLSREGQPASEVRVSAMVVPEPGTPPAGASTLASIALTDNAGRYRLENVPPGRYYIVAGLVDSPTYFPGASSMNDANPVDVSTGAAVTNIDFTLVLPAGVTVSGRVIPSGNAPSAGNVRVLLRGGLPPMALQTTTDTDGFFRFERVRPGNHQLSVSSGVLSQPMNIVVADKDITGLEAVVLLRVPVRASLVVENDGVRPRLGLTFSPFKGGVNTTSLGVNSTSWTTQLPEGEYRVGWSNLPAGYQVKSIMSGSVDLLTTSFVVAQGIPLAAIVVTLGVSSPPPWVKVNGRVTGWSGGPLRLMLSGGSMDTVETPVNPDGSFEFERVLPGSYTARVIPSLPVPPVTITVPNMDLTDVRVAIPVLKEIKGRVEGSGGNLVRMTFTLNNAPGAPYSPAATSATTSNSDGLFTISLPEGEHRVMLNAPGFVVQTLTYGGTDLLRGPIKISRADSAELHVVLAPGGAGVAAGVTGGVVGGTFTVVAPPGPPPPPPPPPPIRVTSIDPSVAQSNLIASVSPVNPPLAQAAGIRGVVILSVTIAADGTVQNATVVSGHPLLNDAAIDAVRQWRYKPHLLNGQPVAVQTTVTINFQ